MNKTVLISVAYRTQVANLLVKTLRMESAAAVQIVSDGLVEAGELFNHRNQLRAFPSSRALSGTPAARFFDDKFLQSHGLGRDFFVGLYDETFDESAGTAGPSDEAIDSEEDLKDLEARLQGFVNEKRPTVMGEIQEAMAEFARDLILKKDIVVEELTGHIVHSSFHKKVPLGIEPLKKLFYVEVSTKLPRIATALFVRMERKEVPVSEGMVVYAIIRTPPPLDSLEAYIHISLVEENQAGKKKYTVRWEQLSREEEKKLGLKGLGAYRMGSLVGTFTLTEAENGETDLLMDMKANPDLPLIPDFVINSFLLGVPGQFLNASQKIAAYLADEAYFQRCLMQEDPACTGVAPSPAK